MNPNHYKKMFQTKSHQIKIKISRKFSFEIARESPKKPLKNSERPTLKTGEYRCCGKEWYKKGITNGQKFACKQCKKETGPKNTITWNKKWYGSFECTVKSCMNQWVSSNTWTVDNKIQTTQCRKCKKSTLPYDIVSEFTPFITTWVINYNL